MRAKTGRIFGNRRAGMFLYLVTIGFIISMFMFLTIKISEKPAKYEPKYIGEHQLALLKTAATAQKLLLFIDEAANPSAIQSVYDLAQKGGYPAGSDCGSYMGYGSWRSLSKDGEIKNCLPDKDSLKYDFAAALNNELYRYLNVYWGRTGLAAPVIVSGSPHAAGAGASVLGITANAVAAQGATTADKPLGYLGSMPPENYEVQLEQKDQLNIKATAKENAEFDIILGVPKKRGIAAAVEAVEGVIKTITDIEGCSIDVPQTDSQSIGSTNTGRLENGVEIPVEGPYHLVNPENSVRQRHRNYATNELYISIQKFGCALVKAYGVKTVFNDVSREDGGGIGHKSHTSGRDIDIGFVCRNREGKRYPCYTDVTTATGVKPEFDPEATWLLTKAIFEYSDVRFVFLSPKIIKSMTDWAEANDPDKTTVNRIKAQLGQHAMSNHVTHFHLRINCPKGDSQCIT